MRQKKYPMRKRGVLKKENMKLTTKTRYGMRAIVEIAKSQKKGPVAVSSIAEKEGISVLYLEKLLNSLKRDGIVKSVRGAQGGYVLARAPKDINMFEIVKLLEGDSSIVFCMSNKKNMRTCEKSSSCVTKALWSKVNNAIKVSLQSVTLKDLCRG